MAAPDSCCAGTGSAQISQKDIKDESPESYRMNIENKLSATAKGIKSSIIRELLKIDDPTIISFGGGVPDPETFPREKLAKIAEEVIQKEYKYTLQYGTTEGDNELKKQYIRLLEQYEGITGLTYDNLVITAGSQEALYLVGLTFADEGSYCAASAPVYLGAASAFKMSGADFIDVPLKEYGIDTTVLERELENLVKKGEIDKFRYLYVVTNFHNPAGITESLENRKKIVALAEKYDFLIIEDDPYGALNFDGEHIPTMFSMAPDRTILLNTFSKVLSPGLRIGVVIGGTEAIRKMVIAKQAVDLCNSPLTQRIAARFMERYDLMEEIKPTIEIYREKRNIMLKALEESFGDMEGVSWVFPKGGLFTWLTLPKGFDTMEMFDMAKKGKILYIPGEAFYFDNPERNTMRLSFCLPSKEEIVEGCKRLRKVVDEYADQMAKIKGIKF